MWGQKRAFSSRKSRIVESGKDYNHLVISSTNASSSFVSSSVETSSSFGISFVGGVWVFDHVGALSVSGVFDSVSSSPVSVTVSGGTPGWLIAGGVSWVVSVSIGRMRLQLVRVRERRMRRKRECFIVRKIEIEQEIEKGIFGSKNL